MGKKTSGKAPTDYVVGRGKPPLHTRFKPGQCGNPGGRKKGSVNVQTLFQQLMDSEIVLTEQGKTRKVTTYEALCLKSLQLALQGNLPALKFLIEMGERLSQSEKLVDTDLGHDDQAIIDAALGRDAPGKEATDIGEEEEDDDGDDVDDDDGSEGPGSAPPPSRPGQARREGRS